MILIILLGVLVIFLGMISAFLQKNIFGILFGVCTILNGIVMIVTAIKSRPRRHEPDYNSEEIADYMLEIAQDIGFEVTFNDLCKMLFLAQVVWVNEIGSFVFDDWIVKIDDTVTTLLVEKIYGDEEVIKTKPIHRDMVWAYGYLLVNIVLDYQDILSNKAQMDILNGCISKIEQDSVLHINDCKEMYAELKPLLSRCTE